MASPANQREASRQAHALLIRSLPGSRRGSVNAHLKRAEHIAEVIWRRWHTGPYQWKVKHVRWYLATQTDDYSASTCYRHWLTARALVFALQKEEPWLTHLNGPWLRPTGQAGELKSGRPPKLPK